MAATLSARAACRPLQLQQRTLQTRSRAQCAGRRTVLVQAAMDLDNASILVAGGGGVGLDVTRKLKDHGSWVWQLQRTDVRRCAMAECRNKSAAAAPLPPATRRLPCLHWPCNGFSRRCRQWQSPLSLSAHCRGTEGNSYLHVRRSTSPQTNIPPPGQTKQPNPPVPLLSQHPNPTRTLLLQEGDREHDGHRAQRRRHEPRGH